MQISSVAKRYAQALYDYAVEGDAKDAVRSDCSAILQLVAESKEFSTFLNNPTLAPEVVKHTAEALFRDKAHNVTVRFLHFLISKDRLSELPTVCEAYEQHICEDLGILKVQIVSAHELAGEQLSAMKEKLSVRYKKEIDADVRVDTSLIGGFKIQVGDFIQDFSILTKLENFEQQVIKA